MLGVATIGGLLTGVQQVPGGAYVGLVEPIQQHHELQCGRATVTHDLELESDLVRDFGIRWLVCGSHMNPPLVFHEPS
jgi:hypothetical protein